MTAADGAGGTAQRGPLLALTLAVSAGGVDAVGYVTLFGLFTAHMSGNSVSFAVHVSGGEWAGAARHGFAIPVFLAGVVVGALASDLGHRRRSGGTYALALAVEVVVLLAFMMLGAHTHASGLRPNTLEYFGLAALPALAMGVQNATVRRAAGHAVRTTFVTGMITDMTEEGLAYVLAHARGVDGEEGKAGSKEALAGVGLKLLLWLGYIGSATLSALAARAWSFWAVALPLGETACALLLELRAQAGGEPILQISKS